MNQIDVLSLLAPAAAAQPAQASAGNQPVELAGAEAFLSQLQLLLGANGPPGLAPAGDGQALTLARPAMTPPKSPLSGGEADVSVPSLARLAGQLAVLLQPAVSCKAAETWSAADSREPLEQSNAMASLGEPKQADQRAILMARLDALRQALPQAVGEIAKQLTISSGQAVQGKIVRVEVVLPETARQTQVASPEESETHRAAVPFDLFTSGAGQPGGRTEAQSIAWLSKALAPPKAAVGEASATVLLPDEGEPATVPLSDGLRLTVSRLPGAQTAESATIVLTLSGDTDESPVLTVKLSFSVLSGSRLEEPAATLMAGKTATESLQPAIGPGLRNPQSEANLGLLRPQPGVSPSVVQLQPAPLPAAGPDWHALGEQKAGPARGIQVAATADQAGLKSNLPQPVTPGDPPREAVSPVLRQVGLLPAMPLDETTTAKAAAVQASSGSVNKGTAVEFAKVRLNPLAVSAGNPAAEAADAKPALKPNAPAITAVEVAEAAPAADKPAVPGADGPDGRPPTTTAPTPQIGLGDSQTSPALPPQLLQFTSPVPQPDYSGALRAALGRINELVQHYKAAGEGLYNAQLELDPPALGKLFINVLVRGDNVAIQVAAVSPASREQLQAGAAQLRQGLIDSGLNVAEMRIVSLDPEDGQSGAGHDSSSQQEGQGNQRGNKSAPRWEPPQKVASSA